MRREKSSVERRTSPTVLCQSPDGPRRKINTEVSKQMTSLYFFHNERKNVKMSKPHQKLVTFLQTFEQQKYFPDNEAMKTAAHLDR